MRPRDILPPNACRFEWVTHWPDEDRHLCAEPKGHEEDHECVCGRIEPVAAAEGGSDE